MKNIIHDEQYFESIKERERWQYFRINSLLLLIHIAFSLPLYILSPSHVFKVNIFSICFYLIGYFFINKSAECTYIFVYIILAEMLFFIASCTLVFGWDSGFHLWMFSLLCTFMKDFINPREDTKKRYLYIVFLTSIFLILYVSLFLITKYINIPFKDSLPNIYISGMFITNSFLTFFGIVSFTRIYTKQMELKFDVLHNQADYDQLTGLGNRYNIRSHLLSEEDFCVNNPGYSYSTAILDIDHFKNINDTFGHDNGDIILIRISTILKRYSSDDIRVCRWGGEEFVIMGNHNIKYDDFLSILESIRLDVFNHTFLLNNISLNVTISIGSSQYKPGLAFSNVLKAADNNLYKAKESGRNKLIY